ncbi:hypothetical protein [Agrococcus sp. Marseille-P2731]|uniref:hypothetical protein n=1 Tax=Agrococcus sp. Marseille-P2731 TaxID=1841862 RepID=UPI0009308493|nr:hypothetical protein [Agrococcus sp. Marseille-P2731]
MLRLDPHLAVFRSSPDRIAIGAQERIADLDADAPNLRAIAALTRGVLPRELAQLIGEEQAQALLATIDAAVVDEQPRLPVVVRGRIRLAEQLHRSVRDAGHRAGEDVVLPVAPWRLPVGEVERLLVSGAAHLPVVVGDAWLQIGPYVPAGGGCARCAITGDDTLLPAHLTPEASPVAAAQAVATVLGALRRASEGALPAGWGARIRQRDGAVSALRRRRPCSHLGDPRLPEAERSRPGTAMAA